MVTIPRQLIMGTRPIRYWLDSATYRAAGAADQLEALRGARKSQPMLVVGNGPSLNKTPLDDFKGVAAIGMNKIDLLYDRVSWRPDLVVCTNSLVVKQHATVFAESEIPVYLSWKARRMMPGDARNVHYFLSLASREFHGEITQGVGSAGTVTYTALQLAYFMGADPVILFGVDHSFKTGGNPNDVALRKGEDVNHFDPNYFTAGTYWGVPNLDLSEKAYLASRLAFEADGRRILDASIGGKLDIFEKIDLDQARTLAGKFR